MMTFKKKVNYKNIFFLGAHQNFDELIEINKSFGLRTVIVTTSDQALENKLDQKKINIFDHLDSKFIKFLKKNGKIEESIFISLGARWIFSRELIHFFKENIFNFHRSRLPFDAGGGGFSWRIMNNDRIDNQLVHKITDKIDEGPILMSDAEVIPSEFRLPEQIDNFSSKRFLSFYKNFINKISNGEKFIEKYQAKNIGSYYPRLNTLINGWIDWNYNSNELINFINAFDEPYFGASTMINNERVYIKKAQLHGGEMPNHPFMTGIITRHDKDWIIVSTKDKNSLIVEIVNNNKKKNIISSLKEGDRFYSPIKYLENSKNQRIRYDSKGYIK